jgi:DNA-directed RNA polymerase II subunit RPB2
MSVPDAENMLLKYFAQSNGKQIIAHQIESFNQFIEYDIPDIIHRANPIKVRGSPEIPLSSHKHNIGLTTSAANTLAENTDEVPTTVPVVSSVARYEYDVNIEFLDVHMRKPTIFENNGSVLPMMPNDARLRTLTYAAPLHVDVKVTITFIDNTQGGQQTVKTRIFPNVHLGKIPVMVGSKFCQLADQTHVHPSQLGECSEDMGGYFIIQGGERIIISQERMSENRSFVFRNNKNPTKEKEVVEIKSIGPDNDQVPKTNSVKLMYHPKNSQINLLRATIPRIKTDIPITILFRALGVLPDKDMYDLIIEPGETSFDSIMLDSMTEGSTIITQEDALEWLSQYTTTWTPKSNKHLTVRDILANELFPHMGGEDKMYEKACFLANMTKKLLWTNAKRLPIDDRDGYSNKRVDLPGFLMASLFRSYFINKMIKDIKTSLSKEIHNGAWKTSQAYEDIINISNIHKIIKSTIIDTGLKTSLATGNFSASKIGGPSKIGVSQVMNRLNFAAGMSHLRRVSTPIEKTAGKLLEPRKLHNSQWSYICPAETPEGAGVGVVKNMSSTSHVTIWTPPIRIYKFLESIEGFKLLKNVSSTHMHQHIRCFVNGGWYGVIHSENVLNAIDELRKAKRCGKIHIFTGIMWKSKNRELWISTEAGRIIRPVYYAPALRELSEDKVLLDQINKCKSWDEILLWESSSGKHLIEYIDPSESDGVYIAMTPEKVLDDLSTTHAEIHPCTILGTTASFIPFPDHNQSPRNAYQSSMGKQAMGLYALNYRERFDAQAHILCYPQKPLVTPFLSRVYGINKMPAGQNIIVAIMTYSGYNQEDSLMINRASLERGMFRSIFYRTYKDEEKKNQSSGEEEKFCKPDPELTKHMKFANYDKLDASGFVPENTYVTSNDILIGKTVPIRVATGQILPAGTKRFKDVSRTLRNNEVGYVDRIFTSRNGEGYSFAKIRVRQDRIPEIGDKFSSRHGQKGTMGMILNPEDMPHTADGIKPDIIVNPHAIPSRMTIAQLMETLMGKIGCNAGTFGDGSPFNNITLEGLAETMRDQYGFEPYGNDILYNGHTGKQMETSIFIGPCFYQRLRHCSADKIHSRASGPLVMLTRQPAEGRARDGGLRFGEMERDCVAAHGVTEFTKERFMECSDGFPCYVCNDCGRIAIANPKENIWECKVCNNHTDFRSVQIPYAYKLMMQEMETMGIASRICTEDMKLKRKLEKITEDYITDED